MLDKNNSTNPQVSMMPVKVKTWGGGLPYKRTGLHVKKVRKNL